MAKKFGGFSRNQGKSDAKWNININSAEYKEASSGQVNLMFRLKSIQFNDISQLNENSQQLYFIKQSRVNQNIVYLYIKKEDISRIELVKEALSDALKATEHYTDESIEELLTKIDDLIFSTPTDEEIESRNIEIAHNWKELLKTLSDPEVRQRFLAFQASYLAQFGDALGLSLQSSVLSPANVIDVLMQDPSATFVTDVTTWRRVFKRKLNTQNPLKIIITKRLDTKITTSDLEADDLVKANGGWGQVVRDSKGPDKGNAWASVKRTNGQTYGVFRKTAVVDVRFTEPIDPNNDIFMNIANIVNNLTGELNDVAKKIIQDNMPETTETDNTVEKTENGKPEGWLQPFMDRVLRFCDKEGISIPKVGSDDDIIAQAVYQYALHKAPTLNILKPENQKLFASSVCYAVSATLDLNTSKAKQGATLISNSSEEQLANISMQIYEIFKELINVKQKIKESVQENNIPSYREICQLLFSLVKSDEEKISEAKHSFNLMLSRINSVPKN